MRNMEIQEKAIEAWESGDVDPVTAENLQAYSDGVNDFVKGVSMSAAEQE